MHDVFTLVSRLGQRIEHPNTGRVLHYLGPLCIACQVPVRVFVVIVIAVRRLPLVLLAIL
jgi:hypothetical protein